jgi:hypothetical protein
MYVEKNLYDVDGKLVIHHENLKRLKRKLEVLQHVYNAPKVYAKIVTEIYRRRNFQEQFREVSGTVCKLYIEILGNFLAFKYKGLRMPHLKKILARTLSNYEKNLQVYFSHHCFIIYMKET